MSSANELKPCPFCGGEAGLIDMEESHIPVCNEIECLCELGSFSTRDAAIAAWNRRAVVNQLPLCLDRLKYRILGRLAVINNTILELGEENTPQWCWDKKQTLDGVLRDIKEIGGKEGDDEGRKRS